MGILLQSNDSLFFGSIHKCNCVDLFYELVQQNILD